MHCRIRLSTSVIPYGGHRNLSLKEWLVLYQRLRVLVLEYNHRYGLVLVSTKTCFISFAMFGAYGAFRTEGVLAIFLFSVGVFGVCFLILYIILLGEVHDRSKDFLSMARQNVCWNKGPGDKDSVLWLRKYLRSLREMRVEVGSAYFIDKAIVLTTFKILFDSMINFLLMTP